MPAIEDMLDAIEAMIAAVGSLDELLVMLRNGFPAVDAAGLERVLAQAMTAAHLGGRAQVEAEGG